MAGQTRFSKWSGWDLSEQRSYRRSPSGERLIPGGPRSAKARTSASSGCFDLLASGHLPSNPSHRMGRSTWNTVRFDVPNVPRGTCRSHSASRWRPSRLLSTQTQSVSKPRGSRPRPGGHAEIESNILRSVLPRGLWPSLKPIRLQEPNSPHASPEVLNPQRPTRPGSTGQKQRGLGGEHGPNAGGVAWVGAPVCLLPPGRVRRSSRERVRSALTGPPISTRGVN